MTRRERATVTATGCAALGIALALFVPPASAQVGQVPPPPANDDFSNATVLDPAGVTDLYENNGATKEPFEPSHAGNPGGASLWYSWTPRSNRLVTLDACISPIDTLMAVYTGESLPELTSVASDDDSCPPRKEFDSTGDLPPGIPPPPAGPETDFGSIVQFTAQAGTTYHIAIDGKDGEEGQILLSLDTAEPEPPPSAAPPPPRALKKARFRLHPARVKLEPKCGAGRYRGHVALQVSRSDDFAGPNKKKTKVYRCRRRTADFSGSGYFRLPRAWWKRAHTKAGITLAVGISREGDKSATETLISLGPRSRQLQYYVGGVNSANRTCFSGDVAKEFLSISPYFTGRVAGIGEYVVVQGGILPYWPGWGYGNWIYSYTNVRYNVNGSGNTFARVGGGVYFSLGGPMQQPYVLWPPAPGRTSWESSNGFYALMAVWVWTQRTGWRFFDYIAPNDLSTIGTRVDGAWCWHPYPYSFATIG